MNVPSLTVSEHEVIASLCRASFEDFVRTFWAEIVPETLVWNWHMTYLCARLQMQAERVFRGMPKISDEVINIPPGTSKSLICSVFFPIWVWTRMPSARCLGASFAEKLALDLSRKGRDLVRCDLFRACFPEIQIKEDVDAKYYFANTKGGIRYAAGSKGQVMGFHFHFIIIDDPIDPGSVVSEAELAAVNHWLKQTLTSRKVDKRVTVTFLIMQRLHENDPSAMFLNDGGVFHTKIPASLEFDVKPERLAKFYKDGLLDPIRMPENVLEDIRKKIGEYGYAGQYGQDPVPAGGGLFMTDKLNVGRPPEGFKRVIRHWDLAGTRLKGSSMLNRTYARTLQGNSVTGGPAFTAGVLMGLGFDGRVWVLNVKRFRLDVFSRDKIIRDTAVKDGVNVKVGIEQEGSSEGKHDYLVKRLQGFSVTVLRPTGDKALRAEPFASEVNKGNVWLAPVGLGQEDWHKEYIHEMKYFPFGAFLDQIDASAGAFGMLSGPRRRRGAIRSRHSMTL